MSDRGLVTMLRSLVCLTLLVGVVTLALGAVPAKEEGDVPAEQAPGAPGPGSEDPATPDVPGESEEAGQPEQPEEAGEPMDSDENGEPEADRAPEDQKPAQPDDKSPPGQALPAQPGPNQPGPTQADVTPAPPAVSGQDTPYQSIVLRNAFGLRTPPPPAPPPEQPAQQVSPSALKLSGIITLLGGRHATFVLQEPGKPQINSDLVAEGDKDWLITNLHVLQIDERAGMVRVAYGGKEMTLDFVNNGLKPPAAPAAAAGTAPGRPGQARPTVPGRTPATAAARGAWGSGAVGITPPASPAASATLTTPNPSGLQSLPTRPTRLSSGVNMANQYGAGSEIVQPQQPALEPEQQMILMRAQEEISRRQGVPFPPSPPIPGLNGPPTPGVE